MAKQLESYSENQKDVYKFWLGFLEKIALLFGGIVLLPQITGQIQYSLALMILAMIIIISFVAAMFYLSRKLWYLPKDQKKEEVKK
jgi:hypothetical protein